MFILCITSDSEVLVKFCHGLLKIIANVRTIYSVGNDRLQYFNKFGYGSVTVLLKVTNFGYGSVSVYIV